MSAGEILGSAAGVAVISGLISYLVALKTSKTQVQMKQMETVEKDRERGREVFIAALDAWDMSQLADADDPVRRAKVAEARRHLTEVEAIFGKTVGSEEFDHLNNCLREGDEEGLSKAASLWPRVEMTIKDALAQPEIERTRRKSWRRG